MITFLMIYPYVIFEKSFVDNEVELYWLKVEPEFESLYDDPRWQQMLDRIGFPEN